MSTEFESARMGFLEAIAAFLQRRALAPTLRYDDIEASEHSRAFAVANATKAALLADLRDAVARAILDGGTIEQFRADFYDIVRRHGWHGWTGEGSTAGELWRTRVIYVTNARKSYAAGRYAQLTDPQMLAVRPYWRWVHSGQARDPRPEHLAWSGMTLHYSDPFWRTHFPPRIPPDYGCRCRVVAVRAPGANQTAPRGWERDATPGTGAPPQDVAQDIQAYVADVTAKLPQPLAARFAVAIASYPGRQG